MGVNFFPCDHCGQSICDCGPYVRCDDGCCRRWCDRTCAKADGFRRDDGGDDDCERSCNFCRGEDVEAKPLLECLLEHFKLSRQEAVRLYFEYLKEEDEIP